MMTHPYIQIPVLVRACASTRIDPNTRTGISITNNRNLHVLVPTYTLMPLTSSWAHALSKKEGRLPTSCKSWQNLSKTLQQWKRKCCPPSQLLKNFEVCSTLVQIFMFLRIIKTWRSILSKCNVYNTGVQNWKVFTHTALHQGPPQHSSRQPFKASLPSYTRSDRGGEETCRARRGF